MAIQERRMLDMTMPRRTFFRKMCPDIVKIGASSPDIMPMSKCL